MVNVILWQMKKAGMGAVFLCAYALVGCAMAETKPVSDHFNGKVFFNPTTDDTDRGLWDVLKFYLGGGRAKWPDHVENTAKPQLNHPLTQKDVAITWVNHASFLIQLPGMNILTDPVWSKRVSPFTWIGPARVREPGIPFEELPKIDVVLISHNHYDHLDKETLKRLNEKFAPKFVVPLANGPLLQDVGIKNIQEFDWWEGAKLSDSVKVTLTPTQHFSARGLFDRNHMLWGSYLIESQGHRIYFGGDAGYSVHYKTIYEKLGAPDIALIGIGAYEPRWFMQPMHMNPEEAVQAHKDLHSKQSIAMHFGTFQLSNEGLDQPGKDLKTAADKAHLPPTEFITMSEGETKLFTLQP